MFTRGVRVVLQRFVVESTGGPKGLDILDVVLGGRMCCARLGSFVCREGAEIIERVKLRLERRVTGKRLIAFM